MGACSVSALRCRNARPAEMFCFRLRSIICSYARVRGMLMEIVSANTGLNAQKVEPRSDSAKLLWRSVGLHVCISISDSFFSSLSPFFTPLLANACVLIPAPSTLSAGGHRRLPPVFPPLLYPPPPPHPISQLILVSVMDHIWERLSRSSSVC